MRYKILFLAAAVFVFCVFLQTVSSQSNSENEAIKQNNPEVTIHAEKRGGGRVNFSDGVDLTVLNNENQNAGASLRLLATADFDSDGVQDVAAADQSGDVRIYRGNADAIYPNGARAVENRARGTFTEDAFFAALNAGSLPIAPDFLFSGDFNADGFSDILAARRGDNFLHLLAGDGRGNFAPDFAVNVGGGITALKTGEIGIADGQTDVVVALSDDGKEKGARLLVFEHPEGAFKHTPEIFKLTASANDLAIGKFNGDSYADVAVASGNLLTVIQERGQAYPWDTLDGYDIKRPRANVSERVFSFEICALAAGKFTDRDGESLAMLTANGGVEILQAVDLPSNKSLAIRGNLQSNAPAIFAPSGVDANRFSLLRENAATDKDGAFEISDGKFSGEDFQKQMRERREKAATVVKKSSVKERGAQTTAGLRKAEDASVRAKAAFLQTISAKPTASLAAWNLQNLTTDAHLANAAYSAGAQKFVVARASDSGKDDLILLDADSREIQIVSQQPTANVQQLVENSENRKSKIQNLKSEITSFSVEGGAPVAVLPMRLNADAVSDLVVLRENSGVPTIVKSAPTQTLTVNSTSDDDVCEDGGTCTLRGAIRTANAGGANTIAFAISGDGVHTFLPATPLPVVRINNLTIDATTQPGYMGTPHIEIKGTNAPDGTDGLKIRASNCVVRGLAINQFPSTSGSGTSILNGGNGLTLESTTDHRNGNNIVESCFLGTDASGNLDKGNYATGLLIFDSENNTVGGTAAQAKNVMSGNGGANNSRSVPEENGSDAQTNRIDPNPAPTTNGVGLAIQGASGNIIRGNIIGLNQSGTARLYNSAGVFLGSKDTVFGGDEAGAGNTVSGNGDPSPTDTNPNRCFGGGIGTATLLDSDNNIITANNQFKGNRIGTNPAGNTDLGNCTTGLTTSPIDTSAVGSITASGRNVISGNKMDGVYCVGGFSSSSSAVGGFCNIAGNNIGTDITGASAIPNNYDNHQSGLIYYLGAVAVYNTDGVSNVGAPGGTTAGGDCTGFCNLIAGNKDTPAVFRTGAGQVGIFNNYVGTNKNGAAAIPNDGSVSVAGGDTFVGGVNQNGDALGNLISGNRDGALGVSGGTSDYNQQIVQGNLIGTDASGAAAIPNGADSNGFPVVQIDDVKNTVIIGGTGAARRNIIAGNASGAICLGCGGGDTSQSSSLQAAVVNNFIGVNKQGAPLGNDGDGIRLGSSNLSVGGTNAGDGNVIANNAGTGVLVDKPYQSGQYLLNKINNTIRGNSIYNNGKLGIDLNDSDTAYSGDGVTVNDCRDEDEGANHLQNYPELYAPVVQNGATIVPAVLRSVPASDFTVDFYANNQIDPTKYGEGEIYLGAQTVHTDGNGFAALNYTLPQTVSSSQKITSTATDSNGNTSEFSCAAGECTAQTGGSFRDAVERAAEGVSCVQPIIVNINTDEPDTDVSDGVCDVDTSIAGSQCSLRAAIQEANARHGFDVIYFNIPGGGVQTINVQTELPPIVEGATIDGSTQPGYNDSPVVVVRRGDAEVQDGLIVQTSDSFINALAVNGFKSVNIGIGSNSGATDNNRIESCFVGINADGTTVDEARSGSLYNVVVGGNSKNNSIGGEVAANGNVIAGANYNVALDGANVQNNKVVNNKIGTNRSGTAKLATPNGQGTGVQLANGATGNIIGGKIDDGGNLISGHINAGISFENADGNTVSGNLIGTDINAGADIAAAIPNSTGIALGFSSNETGGKNNTIGGASADERNIISGNRNGVFINKVSSGNTVVGNYIGANKTGLFALPNTANGVYIIGSNNTIGGNQSAPNIISGNGEVGVLVSALSANSSGAISGNTISYNLIGTDATGSDTLGGFSFIQPQGVLIRGANAATAENNVIDRNTISANKFGVGFAAFSSHNTLSNNRIGTNKDGTSAVKNSVGAILLQTSDNTVGNNVFSGNESGGLLIASAATADTGSAANKDALAKMSFAPTADDVPFTENNTVTGNLIGTNAAGDRAIANGGFGLFVGEGARANQIGGKRSQNAGNTISGQSSGYGIFLGTIANDLPADKQPSDNKIQGNRIGVQASDNGCLSNKSALFISEAHDNLVGSDSSDNADYGNFFGCSTDDAIKISAADSARNELRFNFVGVLPDGTPFQNLKNGITIDGAPGTVIEGNTVGNSGGDGISVQNVGTQTAPPANGKNAPSEDVSAPTVISGNFIGVVKTANNQIAQAANGGDGVKLDSSMKVLIENNDIGGNNGNGVEILNGKVPEAIRIKNLAARAGKSPKDGVFDLGKIVAQIVGNRIGVAQIGAAIAPLANGGNGIAVINSEFVTIGKTADNPSSVFANIISANLLDGVLIEGALSRSNEINSSIIGTDSLGTPLGNVLDGIKIVDAPDNIIGTSGAGNTIAGNSGSGVSIEGEAATDNKLRANHIGIAGIIRSINPIKLPNLGNGINISEAARTIVGGTDSGDRNYIGGNAGVGIVLSGTSAMVNSVLNNFIGTDETGASGFGNGLDGILITTRSSRNQIGGAQTGAGNKITGNGGAGVRIDETAGGGNLVDPNEIFGNNGLGIEIGAPGVLPNDLHDADEGANRGQNYPELNYSVNNANELVVNYKIDSAPGNSDYGADGIYVEFFKADASGQGALFLGFDYYAAANYNGGAPLTKQINLGNINTLGINATDKITATATDAGGNTSEFAPVVLAPTAALVSVGGQVRTQSGEPIWHAVVLLTDAGGTLRRALTNKLGFYRFDRIEAGETYVLRANCKGFEQGTPSQVLFVSEDRTNVDFIVGQ